MSLCAGILGIAGILFWFGMRSLLPTVAMVAFTILLAVLTAASVIGLVNII